MGSKREYGWSKKMVNNTEELRDYLMKIWYDRKEEQERKVVMAQYCNNQGWIDVSGVNMPYCNDSKCPCASSLKMFNDMMKEESKNFLGGKEN